MQSWHYIVVFIAVIWVLLRLRKQSAQRQAISRRVIVTYLDQNPDFETIFPLTGAIVKTLLINSTVFFVIGLDEGFEYEGNMHHTLIVREKSAGQSIGFDSRAEVHVLLPTVELNKPRYVFEDFEQVCWAVVEPI